MDWFLYENGLRHERVNRYSISDANQQPCIKITWQK